MYECGFVVVDVFSGFDDYVVGFVSGMYCVMNVVLLVVLM